MTSERDTLDEILETLFAADSEAYEFVQYQKNVAALLGGSRTEIEEEQRRLAREGLE